MNEYERALNSDNERLIQSLALAKIKIEKLEATKYAPPALEVNEEGIMTDKSQDADWLRARYFERVATIEEMRAEIARLRQELQELRKWGL